MRMPKRWALILAGCAIAAIMIERVSVFYEPKPKLAVAAEAERQRCSSSQPPLMPKDGAAPSVTQPGGIDPLGVSRAIHSALEDCP